MNFNDQDREGLRAPVDHVIPSRRSGQALSASEGSHRSVLRANWEDETFAGAQDDMAELDR
jgi:hypothetical protein